MGEWRVQRTNLAAAPPRNEWLRAKPTFIPAGEPAPAGVQGIVEGSVSADDRVGDLRWTWLDAADPSGWRNGQLPHDFGRRRAVAWSGMIDGTEVRPVRFGAPDPDENGPDVATAETEARRAARKAYRESLEKGGEAL
jgi:hypothetical protein